MKTIKISEVAIINDEDGYLAEQLYIVLNNRELPFDRDEVGYAYKEAAQKYNIASLFEEYLWNIGYTDVEVVNDPWNYTDQIDYDDEIEGIDDIYNEFNQWIVSEWIDIIEDDAKEYLIENYYSEYYSEDELDEEGKDK